MMQQVCAALFRRTTATAKIGRSDDNNSYDGYKQAAAHCLLCVLLFVYVSQSVRLLYEGANRSITHSGPRKSRTREVFVRVMLLLRNVDVVLSVCPPARPPVCLSESLGRHQRSQIGATAALRTAQSSKLKAREPVGGRTRTRILIRIRIRIRMQRIKSQVRGRPKSAQRVHCRRKGSAPFRCVRMERVNSVTTHR